MAKPVLSSFAQALYDELQPMQFAESSQDFALAKFCAALGAMFQIVDDLGRDNALGESGWQVLLDVNRTPNYALPWLGQLIGVQVDRTLTDAQQRAQIIGAGGWQRGTLAAMRAAALPYLTGSKNLLIVERDTDPYILTVITYASETPDSSKVLAALLSQKPAGIVLNYQVLLGQTYQQLLTNRGLYSTVFSTYATYQLLATDLGTYTPPSSGLPANSYGAAAYGSGAYRGTGPKQTGIAKIGLSAPAATPTVSRGVTLSVRARKTNTTDAGKLRVWLYQNTTLIQGPIDITLTDLFAQTDINVTTAAAAISNWSQLHIEVQGISNSGANLTPRVSWVQLQTST